MDRCWNEHELTHTRWPARTRIRVVRTCGTQPPLLALGCIDMLAHEGLETPDLPMTRHRPLPLRVKEIARYGTNQFSRPRLNSR
jgi:hypothetical protein